MRLKGLGIAGLLVIGLSMYVFANSAPVMENRYIRTVQDEPVTFELRATDADIDPTDPDSQPLVFTILNGPAHGVLIGDLTDVLYRAEHTAAVNVTYAPADGYVGTDLLIVSVTDPSGEQALGTTTIEIEVAERRSAGILSGNWSCETTYNTQTGGFTAFRTQLTEVYRVGDLALQAIASLQMKTTGNVKRMVFDALRFQTDYSIFGIDHTSTLAFDPDTSGSDVFDYWLASTRFSFGGVDFTHTLYLLGTQTDSYQALSAQFRLGTFSFANTVRFDLDPSCTFCFSQNDTRLSWTWCDVAFRAAIGFTGAGFDAATFGAAGIPVPGFGFLFGDVVLGASITFDMDGKSLAADIGWRPGALSCIRLLAEFDLSGSGAESVSGDTILDAMDVYGLRIDCRIPSEFGDITFVSATSLDSSHNSSVTGQTDYFELLRLSGPLLACCGYPGTWSAATYFNVGSTMLFDWGMTLLRADVSISNHFDFSFETVFRSGFFGDPNLELTVGWMVRW